MQPRQLLILFSDEPRPFNEDVLLIGGEGIAFNQAANLLGQEFSAIEFDARTGFHLEALAIAAGTIKQGGKLYLRLPPWHSLESRLDQDSLRWAGESTAIASPTFALYFKRLIERFGFYPVQQTTPLPVLNCLNGATDNPSATTTTDTLQATDEQQTLLEQILRRQKEIYLLTAKRGRGKSALLGLLANQLHESIYLTAPNKNAVNTLQHFSEYQVPFIAPDALAESLQKTPGFADNAWLLVDEAAMIPLPRLALFSRYFKHIVFSTTIHSYEGTGRGFTLKFQRILQQYGRSFVSLSLDKPLRWPLNDPLEAFIEELLLLNAEDTFPQYAFNPQDVLSFKEMTQQEISRHPEVFYGLLTIAHYRTSPLDLRRLLDGRRQRFFVLENQIQALLGALWMLEEGGLCDEQLITAIARGERRPKGNLAAQALCLQHHLPQACGLRSLRISRIALLPDWQRKGLGSRLLDYAKSQAEVDFLSVAFSYSPELAAFWCHNGFTLVHLGAHREASSGTFSAIALQGITPAGKALCQQAADYFVRDIALSFHPLRIQFHFPEDWQLTTIDWTHLDTFAFAYYPLESVVPALRRLVAKAGETALPKTATFLAIKKLPSPMKNHLKLLRLEIAQYLEEQRARTR